jgi:hypothetical protein
VIKIIIPAATVDSAIAIRNRVRDIILQDNETASIVDGGVAITTENPVRVCLELQADGFV